jgi:hypothetical protein
LENKEKNNNNSAFFHKERNLMKQKSRNQWLNLGDGNSAFFHKVVKVRNASNLVKVLKDDKGINVTDPKLIKEMAIGFYRNLLGSSSHVFSKSKADRISNLIQKRFSTTCIEGMHAPVSRDEVRKTIFAMKANKAPGPDGFSAGFFHKAWPIVGEEVVDAVLEFFVSGILLKEVNATIITLVPKKKNPAVMGDYRPISCCNIIYKTITKILANRLLPGLADVISNNQGAFIPKRSIAENILLAQELVHDYHKSKGAARCALKVDLMKAYDSVNWEFILHCLLCFGAPRKYVSWVRACIPTPTFSVALNGSLVGFFQGKKGLRQGDPISPYLFVLAMEILSRLLAEAASDVERFRFHPKCSKIKLTHLCFADDLLIFSGADMDSVLTIKEVLADFEDLSGLKANPMKSNFFCAGVHRDDKAVFLDALQMPEGSLPVRYLGVPLITKRLSALDCDALVAKVAGRIDSWLVRHLSFAGRLQLITSVLFSLQVFWARVFILPKKVIRMLEQKFNRFLWCGNDSKAKAKVSWDRLCVPKTEGGLGIKRLEVWNRAAMLSHIWSIFAQSGSLWVAWIETNWLKGRSLWHIPIPKSCSWSWKKLLKLRDVAKNFLSFKVGNGQDISLWFGDWHPVGRLIDSYGFRMVYDSGIGLDARVSSVLQNGNWVWPPARSDHLVDIQSRLSGIDLGDVDMPVWKSKSGVYSCAETWNLVRVHYPKVSWWHVVWFPQAIPRHAFLLWLVFSKAITTKEKMCGWGFTGNTLCRFCYGCQESIEHLFFQCSFCRRIWRNLMEACLISNVSINWDDLVDWSCKLKGKNLQVILCKLCLAAAVYHVWRLRNDLCFGNTPLTEEDMVARIKWEVRTRAMYNSRFKNSALSVKLAELWRI